MSVVKTLRKTALVTTTALFGILITATKIGMQNEDTLTAFFGQTNAIYSQGEVPTDFDMEYGYKSKYANIKELYMAGLDIQEREQIEGTVLLKNANNALPLAKGAKVSLFGEAAVDPYYGASGSGGINTSDKLTWKDAFDGKVRNDARQAVVPEGGSALLDVNPNLYTALNSGKKAPKSWTINDNTWAQIQAMNGYGDIETYGDAAIMIIKRTGGEGEDLPATPKKDDSYNSYCSEKTTDGSNGDYLQLNANEKDILKGLKGLKDAGTIKKIVLILNMASPVQLDFLDDAQFGVDACMWAGSVGEAGTVGVAKLLIGEANPSGHAASTLWYDNLKNPTNNNFMEQNYFFSYEGYEDFGFNPTKNSGYESSMVTYDVYQEGMYLGYKYTETRYEDFVMKAANVGEFDYDKVVAFPFGYGLSYTTFEFSGVKATKGANHKVQVQVTVKNTGSVAGKTPVQIYVAKPNSDYAKNNGIQVPSVELVDFGKTKILEPNESQTLTIDVREKFFTSYDANGAKTYVMLGGDYYVIAAQDSHEAVNALLAAKGKTPSNTENRMDKAGNSSLAVKLNYGHDDHSYSISEYTGEVIRNQFDFADINKYEGKGDNSVKYYDRQHWDEVLDLTRDPSTNVLHKNFPSLKMTQKMKEDLLDQLDVTKIVKEDNIALPTMGKNGGDGDVKLSSLALRGMSYDSTAWDELLDQLTWDEMVDLLSNGRHKTNAIASVSKPATGDENGPNGFSKNYSNASAGSAYAGPTHPFSVRAGGYTVDETTGEIKWIADPDNGKGYTTTGFSSNGVLASTFNKELAAEVGRQIGEEGYWAGCSGLLGGGFNIIRSPYAGRSAEYYSEDAILTGLIGAPETEGIESMGVHCFVKHCALNEMETARHGCNEWINEQALRENYLRAFELVIAEGGAWNVMTAFNRMGTIAVANSTVFAQNWLRKEVGLKGIVETDCAGDMTDGAHGEAYVSRIVNVYTQATDLNEYNYATSKADHEPTSGASAEHFWDYYSPVGHTGSSGKNFGKLTQSMRESCKRIIYAVINSNAVCGYTTNTVITRVTPPWETAITAIDITAGVLLAASVAWVVIGIVLDLNKKKKIVK